MISDVGGWGKIIFGHAWRVGGQSFRINKSGELCIVGQQSDRDAGGQTINANIRQRRYCRVGNIIWMDKRQEEQISLDEIRWEYWGRRWFWWHWDEKERERENDKRSVRTRKWEWEWEKEETKRKREAKDGEVVEQRDVARIKQKGLINSD